MLNHIILQGRLVRDIEVRNTNTQIPVATFTLAVERDYVSGSERTVDFFDIVAWRKTAEFAQKYFGKGSLMIVDGTLQTRKWEDKNGNSRVNWEVIANHIYFGDSKRRDMKEPEPDFEEVGDEEELPF